MSHITTTTRTRRVILGTHHRTGEQIVLRCVTNMPDVVVRTMVHDYESGLDNPFPYTEDIHVAIETITTTYMKVLP